MQEGGSAAGRIPAQIAQGEGRGAWRIKRGT